ncbi:polysaccharide pyruvyl transferase family protein [Arthrobacter sp. HY1533]|uniref:polysaccharide pyruvyl transferase family protein n=1 Tax=Arthrobacter sp. HY1533 TaxID=2970919 RepID=UPI0022B9EB13|nr:polysaccharide pyruvyl transferase family protein [Arthrobacter sp. HY1533]
MNPLLALQSDATKILSSLLPSGTHVALLDFPRHQNAGDSFIWLGTLMYLKEIGVSVDYVADVHCFDIADLRRCVPTGPILITGGGNFGDRWTEHQNFREMLITSFPDRQIIQLPQSLDFESKDGLEKAQIALNGHPDLTILLRQSVDMARAKEWFPNSEHIFCPDLALGLGKLEKNGQAAHDVVLLLREDSEAVAGRDVAAFSELEYKLTDWHLDLKSQFMWHIYRLPENIARVLPISRPHLLNAIQWSYVKAANLNLRGGIKTVSMGRVLVTDRLHGMFLGALLGLPTIAIDNANGKVLGIFRDYLNTFTHVEMAESLDDAARRAKSILSSQFSNN